MSPRFFMKKLNLGKLLPGIIAVIVMWESAIEDDELTDVELKKIVKAIADLLGVDIPGVDVDETTGVITIRPKH